MTPKPRSRPPEEPSLPFDVTQEIDPAFAELLRAPAEPTLTQADFDSLAVDPPRTSP